MQAQAQPQPQLHDLWALLIHLHNPSPSAWHIAVYATTANERPAPGKDAANLEAWVRGAVIGGRVVEVRREMFWFR